MRVYEERLQTPVSGSYDVVVAGGGSAGFAAALNAARHGAKTLVIEQQYMLGGIMTAALMAKIAMEPFMEGIPTEFLMRLGKQKMAIPYEKFPEPYFMTEMTEIPVDAEACKLVAEEMLAEAGAEILYGTMVVGAVTEDGFVKGVIVENKSGRSVIEGKVFIDATGDGDLCFHAGAGFEFGENGNGHCSAANMLSRVGGVDLEKTLKYLEEHPEELSDRKRRGIRTDRNTPERLREYAFAENPQFIQIGKFAATVQKVLDDPDVDEEVKSTLKLRGGVTFMNTPVKDQVLMNVGRSLGMDPLDAVSISKGVQECRRQNWIQYRFLKDHIPGFEHSVLLETGSMIGVRESRRVICDYVHTVDDVRRRARFDDAIMRSNDSIEFHNPDGSGIFFELYEAGEYEEISYRGILVKGFLNLMAIGRCWSADQLALSANRNIGFCLSMGQAAGAAAAMGVEKDGRLRDIDVKKLQREVYPLREE